LPAPSDPAAPLGQSRVLAEATAPGLLLVIVVALMFPGTFMVAGTVLSPYRVLLIALFPFLVRRWLADCGGRPAAVDLLVVASFLWLFLSIAVNNGMAGIPRGTIFFVEFTSGYLIGRTLIRNRTDHKNYFRYLTIVFAVLAPFAVLEMLTGFNLPRTLAEYVFTVPPRQSNLDHRLGMTRAMGTLEHPLSWGLIASMGVANVFYIYRERLLAALGRTGFFVFMTFTSLSTGPLLSVLCQLGLIAWDRALVFLRFRWPLLVYLALFGVLLLRIGGEFQIRDVIVNDVSYAKASAEVRLIVWDYGLMEVKRHPVFGLGLNDWTKPWWRADKTSFENFWLGQAMRFGLPSFFFLALAWGISFARIAMQKTLSPEEADYRRGYLIAMTGLTLVLFTTGPWNSSSVLLTIYVGAGGWFYLQPQEAETRDAAVRRRRAAQVRAFSVVPAAAPAPGRQP
jgi:hypothetical protein